MTVKLLTEHHLEFLSLKGGCTGSSEPIHVKMPRCWKSHVTALWASSLETLILLRANNNGTGSLRICSTQLSIKFQLLIIVKILLNNDLSCLKYSDVVSFSANNC